MSVRSICTNPNPRVIVSESQAFAGGWFHTGDQGFLDRDGFLTLTGRIKELINRGGEKISPLEVSRLEGTPAASCLGANLVTSQLQLG